jgi:hypothetical protein
MSKLQEISGDLLAIANLPPENRNKALLDLGLNIDGLSDYEIPSEQKDLITSIIQGLIDENDADQIAKSKLVFVEDVEEQIAPTKKTRAKKVVATVIEDESEDLPDFIDKVIPILQLPEPIIKLAGLRRKQLHLGISDTIDPDGLLSGVFNWNNAPEGYDFWDIITNLGDLREFKRLYGNKGEKVDELIEFAELNEFVEGLANPVSSQLPDTIASNTLIKDLPEPVKKLVLFRQEQQGLPFNENVNLISSESINWEKTPEIVSFWDRIDNGDLREFKRVYGNEGEKIDAIINSAPTVKTRKARTPKAKPTPIVSTPVVAKQELKYVEVIIYPPMGGVLNIKTYNVVEMGSVTDYLFKRLKVKTLKLNFSAIADLGGYTTQIQVAVYEAWQNIFENLIKQYDTFVKPKLDWTNFENKNTDFDRVALNNEILKDAFEPDKVVTPKPVKVVTPKPVKVVAPKVVKPKPVKVVKPKAVKQKVTKPKVEDDLSFLNDLDNIF